MKNRIQAILAIGLIFLCTNTFGQTTELGPEKTKKDTKTAKTYFDLMVNVVSLST